MNLKKMMQGLVFFLTSLLVFVFLFRALLPTASPHMTKPKTATKEITYTYVALGDSLTEGVGDSTKQGGSPSLPKACLMKMTASTSLSTME